MLKEMSMLKWMCILTKQSTEMCTALGPCVHLYRHMGIHVVHAVRFCISIVHVLLCVSVLVWWCLMAYLKPHRIQVHCWVVVSSFCLWPDPVLICILSWLVHPACSWTSVVDSGLRPDLASCLLYRYFCSLDFDLGLALTPLLVPDVYSCCLVVDSLYPSDHAHKIHYLPAASCPSPALLSRYFRLDLLQAPVP